MAKPLFQDIVPPDKRSIKKIPIPERARGKKVVEDTRDADIPPPKRSQPKKRRRKAPVFLSLLALAALAGAVYFLLPKVSGAVVTLTLKGQPVTVDAQFSATTDQNGTLPYQVTVYQKDGKLNISASGEENVKVKASGVIRIFNNYSSASQKLVANTRFETPQGKIFRISDPVTVPGKKGDTPGSLDVKVTAEEVGADYNVGITDFTIPGFKGDPRYTKIFARSSTSIGGGFVGVRRKIDPAQEDAARKKIRSELQANFLKQMQQNVPDAFVFLPNAYFIEYESLPNINQTEGVVLTERAVFHGLLFKRQDLTRSIALKAVGTSNPQNDIFGTDTLTFSASKIGTTTSIWQSNPLTFSLSGTTTLISSIDTDKIKEELAGKPRKSLNAVLNGYSGIAKAEVMIRPFWKQNFPDDSQAISIRIAPSPISP